MPVSCFLCFAVALLDVVSGMAIGKWQKPVGQPHVVVSETAFGKDERPASLKWLELTRTEDDEGEWMDCSNRTADEDPWMIDGQKYDRAKLQNYKRLFDKWHGRKVAFAGDSLMREVWVTLACAASLLGGTVQSSMVERMGKLRDGGISPHPSGYGALHQNNRWKDVAMEENTHNYQGLAASHGVVRVLGGGMDLTMHFYQFFHTLDLETYQDKMKPGKDSPLVIHDQHLISTLQQFHMTYMNMGHSTLHSAIEELPAYAGNASYSSVQACQDKFAGFIDLLPSTMKVTFVEHPPSHFNTHDGDNDAASFAGCKCKPISALKQQFSYQCERGPWLAKYLKGKPNIQTATWFESMANLCDHHFHEHTSGDCRHFDNNPDFHDPLVANMLKVWQ